MNEETRPAIKECGELRKAFQKMEDVGGGNICCLKEGYLWILPMSTFGNVDDRCWKLLMILDAPIYYEESGTYIWPTKTTYKRILDPYNTEWVVNTDTNRIGFYNGKDLVMRSFYRIGILLSDENPDLDEISIEGKPTMLPVSTDEGMWWVIDRALNKYNGHIPERFVREVLNYYQNRLTR